MAIKDPVQNEFRGLNSAPSGHLSSLRPQHTLGTGWTSVFKEAHKLMTRKSAMFARVSGPGALETQEESMGEREISFHPLIFFCTAPDGLPVVTFFIANCLTNGIDCKGNG